MWFQHYKGFLADVGLAAVIGVVVGVLTAGFGFAFEHLGALGTHIPWLWVRVVVGFCGFALSAYLLLKSIGSLHGSSTDYFIEAYNFMYGRIDTRHAVAFILLALLTVAVGGSIGPEGPALILGGFVASWLTLLVRRAFFEERYFTLVGGAAGVSAVFRAPLTALSFVIELPYRMDIESGVFIETLVSSITAYLVAAYLLGPLPLIARVSKLLAISPHGIVIGIVAGVLGAVASMVFIGAKRVFVRISDAVARRPRLAILAAGVTGAVIAILGYYLPGVSGPGTERVVEVWHMLRAGELRPAVIFLLIGLLKIIATVMTLTLGGTGGVFFPIVAIGVFLGVGAAPLLGLHSRDEVEVLSAALVSGIFAGANKVVVAAIFFGVEVVGFGSVLSSALAASISYLLTARFGLHASQIFYRSSAKVQALLEVYRKLHEKGAHEILNIPAIEVAKKDDIVAVNYRDTVGDALAKVLSASSGVFVSYPVIDELRHLLGYVELEDMLAADRDMRVSDIMRPAPVVFEDIPLAHIIEAFARYGLDRVFVTNERYVLRGIITKTDILRVLSSRLGPAMWLS